MAQSDQVVQNATFPSVRADINDNLAALYSQSSGNSAPAVTVAFQPWIDTSSSPPVKKVRNGSNTAWITESILDPAGIVTAIANGGTGATTATAALAALLPSQGGNTGKGLVTNGSTATWENVSARPTYEIITSSGTWTCPAGVTKAFITVIGGGGGGGWNFLSGGFYYSGGYGGGGGIGTGQNTVTPGASYTVTVGAGGVAAASSNGTSGGNSSFIGTGVSITATGGGGGVRATGAAIGAVGSEGTCSSANANIRQSSILYTQLNRLGNLNYTTAGTGLSFGPYAITTTWHPGARGGTQAGSSTVVAAGGGYGAVVVEYWS